MYRQPPRVCFRHPLTAAESACSACSRALCESCIDWIDLRSRCADCARHHRRWARLRGRIGRFVLGMPLAVSLFVAGALLASRPLPRYLPFIEPELQPPPGFVQLAVPSRCQSTYEPRLRREIIECY